jgi:hypothetical protein
MREQRLDELAGGSDQKRIRLKRGMRAFAIPLVPAGSVVLPTHDLTVSFGEPVLQPGKLEPYGRETAEKTSERTRDSGTEFHKPDEEP